MNSQSVYRRADVTIGCRPGDVALDCGACFGGTSIFFADRAGADGKVFSFEFFPGNLAVYNRNVALNPRLAERIELVGNPVWSDDATEVVIEGSGPATQVHARPSIPKTGFRSGLSGVFRNLFGDRSKPETELSFRTVSIDSFVEQQGVERVDFIKMDIEGAELTALRGAQKTIERFRPSMAICVYHKLIDFYIPQFLDHLDLSYKFHLQHGTVHGDETVLFAHARQ
ncbi:methyltransferase, FkbM family [Roseovarius azorensis]|uniref:Methyltransferase, FkbM family n=1 Tax=Roseovarius azorensis TaxID=1287727 RepID=A0A1H7QJP4_9RHOB|nr:FkbM family methyltransferase [Roseovarius azorensis]SEL47487.1 methyltransferase, FkbM family [Roseovarius azorensis]